MPTRPRPEREPMPHVLQLRLSPELRRFIIFEAARRGVGQGEAVRQVLEDVLRRRTIDVEGSEPVALRLVLSGADEDAMRQLGEQVGT